MMACVASGSVSESDPRGRPVGVFDSGVGGLTVLHELLVRLPDEDFLYLGDTARFPYGERSPEELERFSAEMAEELLARRAKLLVALVRAGQPVTTKPADTSAWPMGSAPAEVGKGPPSGRQGVTAPQPSDSAAPTPSASTAPSRK